jgi:hypothetical protein
MRRRLSDRDKRLAFKESGGALNLLHLETIDCPLPNCAIHPSAYPAPGQDDAKDEGRLSRQVGEDGRETPRRTGAKSLAGSTRDLTAFLLIPICFGPSSDWL